MANTKVKAPDELHWGISYLREDIQDMKADMRSLDGKIEKLDGKIEDLRKEMYNEFTTLRREMTSHLKWTLGTIIAMSGLIVAFIKLIP